MEVKNGRVAQGQTTQKALRDHARKLFAQKGYSGADTGELVQRAKVTKGALYYHFANKRDLYLAVVETWSASSWSTWRPPRPRRAKQAEATSFKHGTLEESAETLAHVILGALTTGARVIATATDPRAARSEVETIQRLLVGLRSTSGS